MQMLSRRAARFLQQVTLPALLLIALTISSCKKNDPDNVDASYERLGDVMINGVTGFALNGDPLGNSANGELYRWRSASGDWGRLAAAPVVPPQFAFTLAPVCEDAAGTIYATASPTSLVWMLAKDATAWTVLSLPDADTADERSESGILANNNGDLVAQTRRRHNGLYHNRIYRRPAAGSWTLVNDRPADNARLVRLADNGDIFFQSAGTNGSPMVIKAGATTAVAVADCAGSTVLPYCGFQYDVSPAGDVVFHAGGTGSRVMYRIGAGAAYPTTAQQLYNLPDGGCNFFGFAALSNGTTLGTANDCGTGEYFLYIRKAGADNWYKAPSLPGGGYVYVITNAKGETFTASRQSAGGSGYVYRVKY